MGKGHVYTKTGDAGKTSLVGGTRVPKDHVRLDAYGTVDELNSFTGFLVCQIKEEETLKILSFIQHKLFTIGASLATDTETTSLKAESIIKEEDIARLEHEMDKIEDELPPLNNFVLPGGSESAARAHLCRTVCRRAERDIYRVKEQYNVDEQILRYINRLSDYFFVLARKESNSLGNEIFWNKTCE
ncbi:cob(I)yrinic acid a,c-diamide adenosyltransferase [Viscerimonas tarda]